MAIQHNYLAIICDGSFYNPLKLAGYSANFRLTHTINNETRELNFSATEARCEVSDNNITEALAIQMSLKKAIDVLDKKSIKINSFKLHSDSKVILRHINNYRTNQMDFVPEKYQTLIADIGRMIDEIKETHHLKNNSISFTHVKAHVEVNSKPIERQHNIVDKNARFAMNTLKQNILSPKVTNNKLYSVILSSQYDENDAEKYYKLARKLAKQGYVARVFCAQNDEIPPDHPFLLGVTDFFKRIGNPSEAKNHWIDATTPVSTCQNYDRVLLRHYYDNLNFNSQMINFNNNSAIHAARASQLMYGEQAPSDVSGLSNNFSGRTKKPSEFVLDLTFSQINNNPTMKWLKIFEKQTKIKIFNHPKQVEKAFQLTFKPQRSQHKKAKSPLPNDMTVLNEKQQRLVNTSKQIFETYIKFLAPEQIIMKINLLLKANKTQIPKQHHDELRKQLVLVSKKIQQQQDKTSLIDMLTTTLHHGLVSDSTIENHNTHTQKKQTRSLDIEHKKRQTSFLRKR